MLCIQLPYLSACCYRRLTVCAIASCDTGSVFMNEAGVMYGRGTLHCRKGRAAAARMLNPVLASAWLQAMVHSEAMARDMVDEAIPSFERKKKSDTELELVPFFVHAHVAGCLRATT